MGFKAMTAAVLMAAAPFVPVAAVNAAPSRCWYVAEDVPSHKGVACDVSRTVSVEEGTEYHIWNSSTRKGFSVKFLETDEQDFCGDECRFSALMTNGNLWESTYRVDDDGAMRLWLTSEEGSPQFIFRIPANLPVGRTSGLRRGQLSETPFEF